MSPKNEQDEKGFGTSVVVAIIGAIVAIITAYFSYAAGIRSTEFPIRVTQTAEARQPIVEEVVVTKEVMVTRQVVMTQIVTPTSMPTATAMPNPIDYMDQLLNWHTDACNDQCGRRNRTPPSSVFISSVPGYANDAIEVLYDIPQGGWVLMNNLHPAGLLNTKGIRFFYKGVGAPNTLEFKMVLRYPGDTDDTTFGKKWNGVTDTGDQWIPFEALYDEDITCWWPSALCARHGNTIDLESVYKIELGISHQSGDTPGMGRGTFDELVGIPLDASDY